MKSATGKGVLSGWLRTRGPDNFVGERRHDSAC